MPLHKEFGMALFYLCCKIVTLLMMLVTTRGGVRCFELSNEGRIRDYILHKANYSSRLRPVLNSENPVSVAVGVQFFAMLELNERYQVITTAAWLTLGWKDELLTWDPNDFAGETVVPMYTDEIWTPKIARSVTLQSYDVDIMPHRGLIHLQSDGTATLGTPIVQTTQCQVIVTSFPFDTQVCAFFFFPENQPWQKVSLFAKKPTEAQKSLLDSSEWKFTNLSVRNLTFSVTNLLDNQIINTTATVFCIVLERYPDYYVKTLVIPSTLMCIMSFVTFLVHPDSGERMSVGVSLVLGLTVFQILVAEILPEASHQSPILNRYLIVTFITACLALPVSLINLNIACGDSAISILKNDSLRKVILEFLPKLCLVSTYSERIRHMTTMHVAKSNPAGYVEDVEETGTHRTESWGKQTAKQSDQTQRKQSINETEPTKNWDITITSAEKIKLESRIFALMMDRLAFICFLIFFVIFILYTIVSFIENANDSFSVCDLYA